MSTVGAQQQACDLLAFCISAHPLKSKQFVVTLEVGIKLVGLLKSSRPSLMCSAVRLLRACLSLEDDNVLRHLCNSKAIDQLVETFLNNGSRYNLLNSAILETFHFIRVQNLRVVVAHLANFFLSLSHVDYVQTFQELKLRHEQNQGGVDRIETTWAQKDVNRMLARRQEEDERKKRDIISKQKQLQNKRTNHNLDDEADLWGNTQAAKRLHQARTSRG